MAKTGITQADAILSFVRRCGCLGQAILYGRVRAFSSVHNEEPFMRATHSTR